MSVLRALERHSTAVVIVILTVSFTYAYFRHSSMPSLVG